jgi:anti-sigma B factor antagonist
VASAPISIARENGADFVLLIVGGEIDFTTATVLSSALDDALAAGPNNVLVDMSGVTFIDSSGLTALIHGYKAATRAEGWLSIRDPSAVVTRLLALTGQLERFTTRG